MVMPNFLIIGAAKAGTTSLYYYLNQHPEIYLPPLKEPHFFSYEGEELHFKAPGDREALINQSAITKLQDYQNLFSQISTEKAVGEASPSYLYVPKAAERIKFYIPDAKLIAILRHPVDRAYSAFLHQYRASVAQGFAGLSDFAQALEEEETFIRDNWMPLYHFKNGGFYCAQLKHYYTFFHPDQIKIYLYEDLTKNSAGMLQDIFRFLEVDDSFSPDVSVKANISGVPRNNVLYKLFKNNAIKSLLKPFLPKGIGQMFDQYMLSKPKLSPEVRQLLIDAYREDILKLQDLIQRDLSKWLQ
jgi:hypothetical protein